MVEFILDFRALHTMPARSGMATRTGAGQLAPMLVVVTRHTFRELERRETHCELSLSRARRGVTLRAFDATVPTGQPIARPGVVESVGHLPGYLRVALLAAAFGELACVRVITPVTRQAVIS